MDGAKAIVARFSVVKNYLLILDKESSSKQLLSFVGGRDGK